MDASDIIAHINQRFGTTYKLVGPYASGESGVASKVIDAASNRYVLKFGAGSEFRPEHAAHTTEVLRDLGYPAPDYVAVGSVEQKSFSLQRVLPGEPIGFGVRLALLPQLLQLNDLQRGRGDSVNDEPERVIRGVMEGYAEFCIIDPFRTYSPESASLLEKLQLWPFADFRDALWRAVLDRTTRGAVAVYLAHMIVRQLDWSMRHHARATVMLDYMQTASEILRTIE